MKNKEKVFSISLVYTLDRTLHPEVITMTIKNFLKYFKDEFELGQEFARMERSKQINFEPKTANNFVNQLNKARNNGLHSGFDFYQWEIVKK